MPCELPGPEDVVDCGREALRCQIGGDLGGSPFFPPSVLPVLKRVLGLGERVAVSLLRRLTLRDRGRLAQPTGAEPDTVEDLCTSTLLLSWSNDKEFWVWAAAMMAAAILLSRFFGVLLLFDFCSNDVDIVVLTSNDAEFTPFIFFLFN